VDDDPRTIDIFTQVLRLEGYEVRTALSAEDGMRAVHESDPDAILVDYNLPLVNGVEFVRWLRECEGHRETPVAIVTGDWFDDTLLRQFGASVAFKPLSVAELVNLTSQLLAARNSIDHVRPPSDVGEHHPMTPSLDAKMEIPGKTRTLSGRPATPCQVQESPSVPEALLVDDDPGFVETLAMLLRLEGYRVISKSTTDAAVQYLDSSTPDVLITDIAVGRSNGWELVRYAKQRSPDLHVVVVTGDADLFVAKWEYFHTPVFLKPFDPVELFDYFRQHVR
jgi:DNA-binding response OmpR family regulator